MANLFGRSWTRRELLSYVGDLSQSINISIARLREQMEVARVLGCTKWGLVIPSVGRSVCHRDPPYETG